MWSTVTRTSRHSTAGCCGRSPRCRCWSTRSTTSASPAAPDPMDALPPFSRAALMLDMDGTLIDLAPTPDAVVVQSGLPETVAALRNALGGALAIVTGRPIETVDRLFGDAPGAVAGEHGGAVRRRPVDPVERPDLPCPPAAWLKAAEAL